MVKMVSFAVSLIFMFYVCNAQVIPDCPDRGGEFASSPHANGV